MKSKTLMDRLKLTFLASTLLAPSILAEPLPKINWNQLPPLPDAYGFASPIVGIVGGDLLVAGGANFSDRSLVEGGKKVWHDRIFLLKPGAHTWESGGKLLKPLAYALSFSFDRGVVCVGGSDSEKFSAKVFLLSRNGDRIAQEDLPALPVPLAMSSGAKIGSIIYIAGGLSSPDAVGGSEKFFALDLQDLKKGWLTLPTWPGPGRFQPVASSSQGFFYLFSGLRHVPNDEGGHDLIYLKDAYRYSPTTGWERLPDLPHPAAAAASPAPTENDDILIIGGVDGANPNTKPKDFHLVPQRIQAYSTKSGAWKEIGNAPIARVCVSTAEWQGSWILPSGEQSAGIRSPEVWRFQISNTD